MGSGLVWRGRPVFRRFGCFVWRHTCYELGEFSESGYWIHKAVVVGLFRLVGLLQSKISLGKRMWGEAISLSVLLMFACSLAYLCFNTLSHCAHTFHAQMLISLIIITWDFYGICLHRLIRLSCRKWNICQKTQVLRNNASIVGRQIWKQWLL